MTEKRKVRTRFAPSPTGMLHLGGIRTALYIIFLQKNIMGTLFYALKTPTKHALLKAQKNIFLNL